MNWEPEIKKKKIPPEGYGLGSSVVIVTLNKIKKGSGKKKKKKKGSGGLSGGKQIHPGDL